MNAPKPLFSKVPGWRSAAYAMKNLHERLLKEESYHRRDYCSVLERAFLSIDKEICSSPCKLFPCSNKRLKIYFFSL